MRARLISLVLLWAPLAVIWALDRYDDARQKLKRRKT